MWVYFKSVASPISRSLYPVLAERSFVPCSLIIWSWLMLCSPTADLSVCASIVCLLCSLIPVASTWVISLHSLYLYLDPPPPCHPPSNWLRLFLSQTFSCIHTPTFSTPVILHTYPPMKMEQSVPKCRHIKFRHQGNTQKKVYSVKGIHIVAKQKSMYN